MVTSTTNSHQSNLRDQWRKQTQCGGGVDYEGGVRLQAISPYFLIVASCECTAELFLNSQHTNSVLAFCANLPGLFVFMATNTKKNAWEWISALLWTSVFCVNPFNERHDSQTNEICDRSPCLNQHEHRMCRSTIARSWILPCVVEIHARLQFEICRLIF
jgi:hypothetical protein